MKRREAIAQGLKRYFTGKPCKKGHSSDRESVSGRCVACGNIRSSERHAANPERGRSRSREWAIANSDRVRESRSRHYRENHSAQRASRNAWRAENPEKKAAQDSRRRARKLAAIPSDFSEFDAFVIQEAHAACKRRAELHGEPFHVDHMIPLSRGGLHCATNVQVIPARLNLIKGQRLWLTQPGEWIAHA
ncbi:glycolate dehydrogenase [Xanthomonas phage FoX1]|uniref:Glycolate dehydrogenase n=1 Tax=Xanthomonas phage FoX1 TaxID=2723897 RepID=A0A858NP13_9CAUD|nr:glycolate dehydrogenase [Xanthomonas phage FoX1]QJB21741.1 glycolate dehydrogenase [Xanthomonas phage FoX1]